MALSVSLSALSKQIALPNESYDRYLTKDIDLIVAKEYSKSSKEFLKREQEVIEEYSKSYGYRLDDRLYLGVLSSNNQIANAFSTQMPLNMQMDYIAGALHPDYFASKSWIDMLFYHETSHNFQINPKKNLLSRYAHKILKNSFYNGIIVPIFPIPNNLCSPFNLEGNAVLNESTHKNGGRLYSGVLRAMAVTQAKKGYITPKRTYNQHLFFPYETHNYIVGGFFQLFLAQRYGIDQVNRYFYNFSGQWIPIFTNGIFKESFKKDYEELIAEYEQWLKSSFKDFKSTDGKLIVSSKSMVKLNSDDKEIYFLVNDDRSIPYIYIVDKKSGKFKRKKATLKGDKLFRVGDKFYSLSSAYISPTKIKVGLFDEDGNILEKSSSKAIQYISDDGKDMIYFDIPSSLNEPKAYENGKLIGKVNSSILRSKVGDIYFFKQDGRKRVLYKNSSALYSFDGYFGYICDVDESGGVYFVANSKDGSTLYLLKNSQLFRALDSDDVIDARLLDDSRVLLESIDGDGVNFTITTLKKKIASNIYSPHYFFENSQKGVENLRVDEVKKSSYSPISNLHYSSLDTLMSLNSDDEYDIDISANFSDALGYNRFTLFGSKYSDDTIAGLGYDNSQYRLNFGFAGFGVIDHDKNVSNRGYGFSSYLQYPIYKSQYKSIDSKLSYTLSDDREDRSPLDLTLSLADKRAFGHSMYLNYGNFLDLSVGVDRGDIAYGAKSYFSRELGSEWYMGANLGVALSDMKEGRKRGIKIDSYVDRFSTALDFTMPSLNNDIYVKQVIQAGLSLKKVLNYSKYFFTFPISLRREALYTNYNYYDLKLKNDLRSGFNEFRVGFRADLLYFNSLPLPLKMEYIYNPDLKDSSNFRVIFDMVF